MAEKRSDEDETTIEFKKKEIASQLRGGSRFQPGYKRRLFHAWLQSARSEAKPEPISLELRR